MKKILTLLFVLMFVLVLSNGAMAFPWFNCCPGDGDNGDEFDMEECPEFACPWDEPVMIQGNTANVTQAGKLGDAIVYQSGDKNFAMVNQWGEGPNNYAYINQTGYGLTARVFQGGKLNEAIIYQTDIRHKATVRQPGDHNYAYVSQSF